MSSHSSDTNETLGLAEYVASQDELIKEAGLALPHQFNQCTYALGHIRQAVYLCLTCPEARGICSACSIACHTEHNQVELFPKRNFRCDCPTEAIAHACTLHHTSPQPEPVNALNTYGQNFQNQFCRCGRPYDAKTEREPMIQCLSCEDWFHESCCMLRTRPDDETPPEPEPEPESTASEEEAERAGIAETDDAASVASSSGLPPPLITASEYESFVCRTCVSRISALKLIVGTPGAIAVVRDSPEASWRKLGVPDDDAAAVSNPAKRAAGEEEGEKVIKRARADSSGASSSTTTTATVCRAPQTELDVDDPALCSGDVFLTDGFRERWCRCDSCLPSLEANQYLLEEEETYEPPEDPDSGLSLDELGMRALERLPRERAIDGILAFNKMRDDLKTYLKPFAEEGKVVAQEDVQSFFERLKNEF